MVAQPSKIRPGAIDFLFRVAQQLFPGRKIVFATFFVATFFCPPPAETFGNPRSEREISHWFWGILPSEPHEEDRSGWIFDSWDALFDYLDEVDEAEEIPEPKASRWVLLDVGSR